MRRFFMCCVLFVLAQAAVWAGDVAVFVNLGFSQDSRNFMFAQYGLESTLAKPFAELYAVYVNKNIFLPGGVQKETFNVDVYPGQDGLGALFTLIEKNINLVDRYKIDHLAQGRIVYVLIDGQEPKSHIEFRDFRTGNQYSLDLIQRAQTTGPVIGASYHIILDAKFKDGTSKTYTVGLPGFVREGVTAYRIKQVILAPDEKALVFVVEKEYKADTGKTIRYMVETQPIN